MIGRSAADPTANNVATVVRPDGSSLGTRTSSRRPTAAPAARTRSRLGLRSAKTTRSTSSRRVAPSARTTAEVTRSRPPTETSASAGIGPMSGRTGTGQRLACACDLRPGPDQQGTVARPDPEPFHQADDGPRRHDPRPVRTRYERNAVVRAGRRHDRAGPDLEMGVLRRSRSTSPSYQPIAATPVRTSTPAASAAAASCSSVPIAWPEPAPRIPCQPAPIPGSASMTVDAGPGLGRTQRGEEPGASAADDEDVRVDAPRSAGRRGPASGPPPPADRVRRTSAAHRDSACAAGAVAGNGGGRRSAGSSATRARPATAGRARRMARRARRARPGPRAPGRGTTGRSARRRPRTRTSRTGRSSTSARAVDGSGSCATAISRSAASRLDRERLALDAFVARARRT